MSVHRVTVFGASVENEDRKCAQKGCSSKLYCSFALLIERCKRECK